MLMLLPGYSQRVVDKMAAIEYNIIWTVVKHEELVNAENRDMSISEAIAKGVVSLSMQKQRKREKEKRTK